MLPLSPERTASLSILLSSSEMTMCLATAQPGHCLPSQGLFESNAREVLVKAGTQRHQEFAGVVGHREGNTGCAQETSPVFAEPVLPGQIVGLPIAGGSGMGPLSP